MLSGRMLSRVECPDRNDRAATPATFSAVAPGQPPGHGPQLNLHAVPLTTNGPNTNPEADVGAVDVGSPGRSGGGSKGSAGRATTSARAGRERLPGFPSLRLRSAGRGGGPGTRYPPPSNLRPCAFLGGRVPVQLRRTHLSAPLCTLMSVLGVTLSRCGVNRGQPA